MRTTKFNMKDFGLRLRKLRQACELTQEEFCDMIGISDTHYRKIEAGTRTGKATSGVVCPQVWKTRPLKRPLGELVSIACKTTGVGFLRKISALWI